MPRFLPQNTIPVSITNKSIVAQTYQKPDEGNRSVYFELSGPTPGQCYQINIPNWNSNTQTGLSQICALRVDAAQLRWVEGTNNAAVPIATIFFPDSGDYIEISEDSYGIYPVVTSGSTFYINFPSGGGFIAPALLAVTVLNFYEAPLKTNTGPLPIDLLQIGKTLVNGINGIPVFFNVSQSVNASDNITQIGGSSANIANGRLPVDIQAQTLSRLNTRSNQSSAVSIQVGSIATTGLTTFTLTGSTINIVAFEIDITQIVTGASASFLLVQVTDTAGNILWEREPEFAAGMSAGYWNSGFILLCFSGLAGCKVKVTVVGGALSTNPSGICSVWFE